MLEALFWIAVGATLYHFFPRALRGIYQSGKALFARIAKR